MKTDLLSFLQWTLENTSHGGPWTICTNLATDPDGTPPSVCIGYAGGIYNGNVFRGYQPSAKNPTFDSAVYGTLGLFDILIGEVGAPVM